MDKNKINIGEFSDNPLVLFNQLYKIWRQEIRSNDKKVTKIIIELHKKQGLDLCDLASQAIDSEFDCFDVHHILEDAIPLVEHNLESILKYLEKINSDMQYDMVSGIQYDPIKNLTIAQPKFARKLLENLIKSGEPFVSSYISTILENLPNLEFQDLHNQLLTLISHDKEPVVFGAVIALGNLGSVDIWYYAYRRFD